MSSIAMYRVGLACIWECSPCPFGNDSSNARHNTEARVRPEIGCTGRTTIIEAYLMALRSVHILEREAGPISQDNKAGLRSPSGQQKCSNDWYRLSRTFDPAPRSRGLTSRCILCAGTT